MKRKISASDLNREVMRLREQCACANKALREVEKQCNSLSRLLEYAVWEEDMYRCDPIVFTGPTRKFVELLTPMLLSNRFKTAGKNNREAFLRNIDNIIQVRPDFVSEPIKFSTLLDAVKRHLPEDE